MESDAPPASLAHGVAHDPPVPGAAPTSGQDATPDAVPPSAPHAVPGVVAETTRDSTRDGAPWFYRRRSRIIVALVATLLIWPFGRMPLDAATTVAGFALIACGIALRVWSIRQIGGAAHRRSAPKAPRLVTWGPFAWSRNPIYIANLLVFAGFCVLAGLAWMAPLLLAVIAVQYHFTVRYEEGFLEDLFGDDFRRFRRATPRWLGVPRSRAAVPPDFSAYPWRKVFRRERGFLVLQVAGGLMLILVSRVLAA